MVIVRCPCGRQYRVAEELLGRRVRCAACNRTFVAARVAEVRPATRRAAPRVQRMRIGELALSQGLVTRDQLQTCLEYQQALRRIPTESDRRLGEILVREGLLKRAQLDRLLRLQREADAAQVAARVELPRRPRPRPVTEEQRAAIRRGVEEATRQRVEREIEEAQLARWEAILGRVRAVHVVAALAIVVAGLVAVAAWPAPRHARVLARYLESCGEDSPAPDASLAATDLGIEVVEFGDLEPAPPLTHDYRAELAKLANGHNGGWEALLEDTEMPEAKRAALALAANLLPENSSPANLDRLEVTVAPVVCHLVFRRRGMGMKIEGRYRFWVVRVRAGDHDSGWKVAGFEPLPGAQGT